MGPSSGRGPAGKPAATRGGGGAIMHARALNYAMHNYAQYISMKTQGDCKQEGSWDCDPPETDNTAKSPAVTRVCAICSEASLNITIVPSSANLLSFGSRRDTMFFLVFRRWKNFIVLQSIFRSGNMCSVHFGGQNCP